MGKLERKRTFGRPGSRWDNNIKTDLQEVGWDIDWIDQTQDRDRWTALLYAIINLWVP